MERNNGIAKVLMVIGIAEIILGFIAGLVFGRVEVSSYSSEQIWSVTFIWWISSFVSGMLVIGLSEIIELLHKLNLQFQSNDVSSSKKIATTSTVENTSLNENKSLKLAENGTTMIIDYFEKKGEKVQDIIMTPFEDLCLVKVNDKFELVEVGGFNPSIKDINEFSEVKEWFNTNKNLS
ncbi:hypothetical protein D7Z54_09110 [Salibacterium salarium]|uniref:Uncharacterized protein n=1 Tax=Salibacterium salarium TaxID=284579 RepID=A0A428N690_9BACI|nr:hypothetical protein [Salibacterium salarium]RSL33838.1 hypothetical protein D7Z54_09110 [Salibacterium salarium]